MKRRILACFLCLTMLLSCMACSNGTKNPDDHSVSQLETGTENEDRDDNELPQKDKEIGNIPMAVTDFSIRLLQAEGEHVFFNSGGGMNRLLSPFSVLTAMSMVTNGAKNETKQQLEEVLGISIENLNEFLSKYMQNLPKEEGNRFHIANSIWFTEDESFTIKDEFLTTNQEYYGADIYEIAFNSDAVSEINHWVEDNTDGLIKEIINEIPADAMMYLINALVFDAEWEETYDESDIRTMTFTTSDGIEQEVDMMFSTENLYLEDENAIGFMKYYKDREYAFVALLPNKEISLPEYIQGLTGEHLYNLLLSAQEVETRAWLPQFEVHYNTELKETLQAMGMVDVFDSDRADLSGLGTSVHGNLYVDRVIHKTYMEVSPVGTKAGAATAVEIRCESGAIPCLEVKEVCLNRPFLYMIVDCEYNQPIFIGTVNYIHPYRCGIIDDVCGYPTEEEFVFE